MSNRKKVVDPETGEVKKVYVPRSERREKRNARRAAMGAPPERHVGHDPDGKSSLGVVEQYDPETGQAIGPPRIAGDVVGDTAFLLEGVQFVYNGLGGHRGFLEWAKDHETKFRELAMKLIPAQVSIHEKQLGMTLVIEHALPVPGYEPKKQTVVDLDEEGNVLQPAPSQAVRRR